MLNVIQGFPVVTVSAWLDNAGEGAFPGNLPLVHRLRRTDRQSRTRVLRLAR